MSTTMKDYKNDDTFQKGKTFLQIILLEKDPRFMILHTSQNGVASFWVAIDCHLMINIIIYQLRNLFINRHRMTMIRRHNGQGLLSLRQAQRNFHSLFKSQSFFHRHLCP